MMRIGEWTCAAAVLTLTLVGPALSDRTREDQQREAEARLKKDLFFLASPQCEGRGPTTRGINLAADHVAAEFKKAGLKPAFKGGYFQPFPLAAAQGKVALEGPGGRTLALKPGADFNPLCRNQKGAAAGAVVFAGFGITCKEPAYDDYADLDVAGKVVVLLRDTPRAGDPKRTREMRLAGSIAAKLARAQKNKAAAVLLVNDVEAASEGDTPLDFSYAPMPGAGTYLPAVLLRRDLVEKMLPTGKSLTGLEKGIGRDLKPQSFDLPAWTARLEVEQNKAAVGLKNVVGVLDGAGPLADETVVLGCHYDHLGFGGSSSLAGTKKRLIHYGADDNASGTSAVIELARRFAAVPNRQGRRLVFAAFSGEELGLLGSSHYCAEPPFPLAGTAAMLNLDMVGRPVPDPKTKRDRLLTEGHGTAKAFKELIDGAAQTFGFTLSSKAGGFGPSDHASFCAKKIPVLFLWTGTHADYHRPSDTPDRINFPGMRRVVDMAEKLTAALAGMDRPAFIEVKGSTGGRMTGGPRLGIRPGYGDEDVGVKVEAVVGGGAADRGGVKDGDLIVEIAGKPVKNIATYMQAMSVQKAGATIEVVVQRSGKKARLKLKLE